MRILLDITHPAHVHFFRNAIRIWNERGDEVAITARNKDLTTQLLDSYKFPYTVLSTVGAGLGGLAKELIIRDLRLLKYALKFNPDVMAAIGGIYIAHVGWITRTPSVVFTDTENATLSNKLTYPFAKAVCTPDCFEAPVPVAKHLSYPGYHELAYTHPKRFTPDPTVLENFGLKPDEDFIFLRLVSWRSAHDVSDSGFVDVIAAVRELNKYGKILISAEGELPIELKKNRVTVSPELVHHLLYFAKLVIGESATMASESSTLGTPAIFISTSTRGYTNEQEEKYGLVNTYSDPATAQRDGLAKALEILREGKPAEYWQEKRKTLLADKIDVTEYVVNKIDYFGRR